MMLVVIKQNGINWDVFSSYITKGKEPETRNLEKFWSAVQNFSAAQWVKFVDTGHAPIQFHANLPHGKSPSQMAAAASYKWLVVRWAWLDRLHQFIWNVIRAVIGWKPLIKRIRLHFVNMLPGLPVPGCGSVIQWCIVKSSFLATVRHKTSCHDSQDSDPFTAEKFYNAKIGHSRGGTDE